VTRVTNWIEHFKSKDEEILEEYKNIDAENLSYDFFKNLTSMSIFAFGGFLTISEKVFKDNVETWEMFLIAGLIAASGIISLQCMMDIVQVSRGKKDRSVWLRWGHQVAPALLGGGIGAFLAVLAFGILL